MPEFEWLPIADFVVGLAGVTFSGLRLLFDWNKERKRNNPPSHDDKTDRNVDL